MTDNTPDVRPEDALQVAQRALQKANELEAENERLRERVAELEATQPDTDGYPDDRDVRVGMVRSHLIQRAKSQHGKAAIDYKDIKHGVFNAEPSAGHCYDLMDRAATAEGFEVRNPAGENKQLVVDLDRVKDLSGVSRVNKDVQGVGTI